MTDVAKAAGVSPMTVSRAFKKDASVGDATRARILQVARELGYVFDATASNLRSKRTGFVAVTVPSLNNANFADTVTAMTARLAENDLQVLLGYTNYNITGEEKLVEQLLRRRPDALVLTGGRHSDQTRRVLTQSDIPVIETWDLPADPIRHVVGFSNAQTMQDMVDHLVAKGHRHLAFIGGEAVGDTRGADRRRGFVAALQRHDLPTDALISAGPAPISMRSGAEAMAHLLADHPKVSAVVCVSDLSAFGALTQCQRQGIDVPDDMAIAGFGNFELSQISFPAITTIDAQSHDIGLKTADLLIRVLGDRTLGHQIEQVTPRLIARASTGD
ncbi:MAG: substrate-binding domain-containing protein [Sedimentitalea sp.]